MTSVVDVIKVTTAVAYGRKQHFNVKKHFYGRRKASSVVITHVSFTLPLAAYGVKRTAQQRIGFITSITDDSLTVVEVVKLSTLAAMQKSFTAVGCFAG